MARIAVMGAGIAGLATALFLARSAHEVTLFEQEATDPGENLDDAFFRGPRPRVPHAIQPHALLGPARAVLKARAPDVYAHMLDLGAWEQHEFDWFAEHPPYRPGDEDLVLVRLRRIVLESALRTAVEAQGNVTMYVGEAVRGLVTEPGADGLPWVTGLRFTGGRIGTDLVVDATGRRSPVIGWLTAAGARTPQTESHRVGLAYACRWYRTGRSITTAMPRVPYTSATPHALAIAFPSDNDLLGVALVCTVKDPTLPALRDPATFDALARLFPSTGAWLSTGPLPVGDVQVMAGLDNHWSPTADESGLIATGVIRVGDALVHTNPTMTQGISLALRAAEHIADTAHRADRPGDFAWSYDRWTRDVLKPWFDLQVSADRDNEARLSGTATAVQDEQARQRAARFSCALEDPVVMRAWAQARHMVRTPRQAFAAADVQNRIENWLKTQQQAPLPPSGPSRGTWETVAAGGAV
ncbi:NAD(P)/FAD-dependent oxidoreductase [Streptomyces sp. YS415]|uniref:NAD(P)/FAD-dependent oxidoreductase n=1 Tax=Streptomyces sp. YS415 TaxID=2944806 RepID=UPI0020210FD3|nr:NAD(P)-binding protein [Streptomyces sp. YS415]MCL7425447.1 NAD(P)-binding protein [Streptomyces sp. YS415]